MYIFLIQNIFNYYIESMTVIKGIGVAIDKTYLSGNKSSQFIELSKIKELVIFERLTPFSVQIVLAIIPNEKNGKLKPLFEVYPFFLND